MLSKWKVLAVVSIAVVCDSGLGLSRSERKVNMSGMPKGKVGQLAYKKSNCEYFKSVMRWHGNYQKSAHQCNDSHSNRVPDGFECD